MISKERLNVRLTDQRKMSAVTAADVPLRMSYGGQDLFWFVVKWLTLTMVSCVC